MRASRTFRFRAILRSLVLIQLLALLVPALGSAQRAQQATPSIFSCPVTIPNGKTPPGQDSSASHLGGDHLWTVLPRDGVLNLSSEFIDASGTIATKQPWWRDTAGVFSITGERIDAPAPPLRAEFSAAADDAALDRQFYAVSLFFPAEGCWRVTGRVADHALTYVMEIVLTDPTPPEGATPVA